MALLSCFELVMMTGPSYIHIDLSLDLARAAAQPTPKEDDGWRLCTVHIKNLIVNRDQRAGYQGGWSRDG